LNYSNHEHNQQLAEIFRQHRTAKNMSLEEIAAKTGIPALHLNSIENGKFEQFDSFYLKMYLKKYGSFLSIDLEEVYAAVYGMQQQAPEEAVVQKKAAPAPLKQARRPEAAGKIAGMALLAILVIFGIYFSWDMLRAGIGDETEEVQQIENPNSNDILEENRQNEEDKEEAESEQNAGSANEESELEENPASFTEVELASHEGIFQNFTVFTSEEAIEIAFIFSANTAVAPLNGMPPLEFAEGITVHPVSGRNFTTGETGTIELSPDETLQIWIQSLSDLQVTVNGETIEPAHAEGAQVLTFNIETE